MIRNPFPAACLALALWVLPAFVHASEKPINIDPFSRVTSLSRKSVDVWLEVKIDKNQLEANGLGTTVHLVSVRIKGATGPLDINASQAGIKEHAVPGVTTPEYIYWELLRLSPEQYKDAAKYQLIGADTAGKRFITNLADMDRVPAPKFTTSLNVKPIYSQELEDGSKLSVIQFPIHADDSSVTRIENQPVRWSFDANPSTQSTDKSAGYKSALAWDFIKFDRGGNSAHHSFRIAGTWNQRATSRVYNAAYNVDFSIPGSTGLNGILASLALCEFSLQPSFEWREKLDATIAPEHQATAALLQTARLELPKLYPFLGSSFRKKSIDEARTVLDRSPHIDVVLLGYWFPSEQATGGATVHHFESRAEFELHVPIPKFTAFDVVLSYGTGAVASSGYSRSNTFGIEVRFFGVKSKLYSSTTGG